MDGGMAEWVGGGREGWMDGCSKEVNMCEGHHSLLVVISPYTLLSYFKYQLTLVSPTMDHALTSEHSTVFKICSVQSG